jgi:sulfonate dioxygenase
MAKKPTSVADYEKQTSKQAQDRQLAIWNWKQQGFSVERNSTRAPAKPNFDD